MDSIDQQYKFTSSIFNDFRKTILKDIEISKFKKSTKAIYRQQEKLSSLLKTLLSIEKIEDAFYAVQVLTRSAIEYHVLGHYIWTKARITQSDKVGEEFYLQYNISEFFKRQNYELKVEGIRDNVPNHNTFQNILKKFPHFKGLDEHELQEVNRISNQFDIRLMLSYLINDVARDDRFLEFHKMMLSSLSEYNTLSSYVHGGPSAELETYENIPNTDKLKKIKECIDMVKLYTRVMKENVLFLFAEYDVKYFNILEIIMKFRSAL